MRWGKMTDLPGVDLRCEEQLSLADELAQMWEQLPMRDGRYQPENDQYGVADAAMLHAMLRKHRPKRILEVGSGHSTAVMLDTVERFGVDAQITCVEPHPERLLSTLRPGDRERVVLHTTIAQDVPVKQFCSLRAGDLLFIDSTHVVKPGSDVVWLFLHVLPALAPGVLVHVHDIFWPFEYPEVWLQQRRDWTELYLLRATLSGTSMWQIEMFSSWLWNQHPEVIPAHLREPGPSNIWLRKLR